MNATPKAVAAFVSLQVQSSFQALPLGAACIASAVKADPFLSGCVHPVLSDFCMESPQLAGKTAAEQGALIAESLASLLPNDGTPAAVGFSLYVWSRPALEAAARALSSLRPDILLFAGGPEVTSGIVASLKHPFRYLLSGEGESSAVALLTAWRKSESVSESVLAPNRCVATDPAKLSSPWLDGTLSACEGFSAHRGALWELARGCPYSCSYCYESLGEKRIRAFPLERLEKELEHFTKNGVERVFVLDPTYNASRDRALKLLDLIEKKTNGIHFHFEVRAELLDKDLVNAFSRIPCSLQIGLQSSNPDVLKAVNRPSDLKTFSRRIAMLNDSGVVFGLDLMYGLPGDTLSSFRTSLDYAISLYPNNLEIFRLSVLPGTALYDDASALGLVFQKDPPYSVESTSKCAPQDLAKAASLARACDVFYSQGRAVTWFLSLLRVLKLKPSQFFQDFSAYLASSGDDGSREYSHAEAQAMQIEFCRTKLREKGKGSLENLMADIVALNGAWTRALAEGETSRLQLSWHPEDLFSGDAMDLEFFLENVCMEACDVTVFPGPEGPDIEIE